MANSYLNDFYPIEHPLYSTNTSTPSNSGIQYASYRGTLTRMMNLYRSHKYTNRLSRQNQYSDSYDDKLSALEEGISTLRTAFGNIQGLLIEINDKMKDPTFCKDSQPGDDTLDMPTPEPLNECEVKNPDCSEYIYLTFMVPLIVVTVIFALFLHHRNTWNQLFSNAENLEVNPYPRASISPSPSINGFESESIHRSRTPTPPVTWFSYIRNQKPFVDFSLFSTRPTVPNPSPAPNQYADTEESSSTGSSSNPSYREYILPPQDAPQQYEMTSFSRLPPAPPLRFTSIASSSVIAPGNADTSV